MAGFRDGMDGLVGALDPTRHDVEIKALRRCRSVADLDALAATGGGWLTSSEHKVRLRLVKHGSGTFLVLSYDDGWGTTLVTQPFERR